MSYALGAKIPTSSSQRIDRRGASGMLMTLSDHWKLTPEELDALGLIKANRGNLTKHRRGEPISANRDTLGRGAPAGNSQRTCWYCFRITGTHPVLTDGMPNNWGQAHDRRAALAGAQSELLRPSATGRMQFPTQLLSVGRSNFAIAQDRWPAIQAVVDRLRDGSAAG